MTYLRRKFNVLVERGFDPTLNNADAMLIEELRSLGIVTLKDLDKIVPDNLTQVESEVMMPGGSDESNFCGLLRDIMMIHDPDRYFRTAWKEHWTAMDSETAQIIRQFGIDIDHYAQKYDFEISETPKKRTQRTPNRRSRS